MDHTLCITKKRYPKVEKYLEEHSLEIEKLQSYIPLFDLLGCQKSFSKWNTLLLKNTLVDIEDPVSNIGRINMNESETTTPTLCPFFVKCVPLLDMIEHVRNTYTHEKTCHWLPSKRSNIIRTFEKIQNVQNTAYVEGLCSVLMGTLSETGKCPHYGSVYGLYCGILPNYEVDISDDYSLYSGKKWFKRAVDTGRVCVHYETSSNDDEKSGHFSKISNFSEVSFENIGVEIDQRLEISHPEEEGKRVVFEYSRVPVQIIIMEKFEVTFQDLVQDTLTLIETLSFHARTHVQKYVVYVKKKVFLEKIKAWMFQLILALVCANKAFQFVHNDLHIKNVMAVSTKESHLFYRVGENTYKVPTHGYCMKIIDFGRSTFKYNNVHYFGDVFKNENDAGGQYTYPYESSDDESEDDSDDGSGSNTDRHSHTTKDEYECHDRETRAKVLPRSSFDLCRFACSFVEDFDERTWRDLGDFPMGAVLLQWCQDDAGNNLLDIDGFGLYKHIARFVTHTKPVEQLNNSVFEEYRVDTNFDREKYFNV